MGPPPVPRLTLDALLELRQVPNHFSDHNGVLKYVRDQSEYEGQVTKELSLEWDHTGNFLVVLKPPGGVQDYSFSDTDSFQWSAKWLLCNLKDEDLEAIVTGPAGRGRGIVKAVCSKVDNASSDGGHYDHKRETAEKHGPTWKCVNKPDSDHDIWDFVITRDDFTSFWLHPNWGDNIVHCGEVRADVVKLQPPPTGRGGSGKGQVYKHFKEARTDCKLKFDKAKNELKGNTRAKVGQTAGAPPPVASGTPAAASIGPRATAALHHARPGTTVNASRSERLIFAAVAAVQMENWQRRHFGFG